MHSFLIVEDTPEDGKMYLSWMNAAWPGANIQIASTTQSALAACEAQKFDVVIADIDMGTGDDRVGGLTVANTLKETNTPVIVVTGLSQVDIYRRIAMYVLHAWDFLQKPVNEDDFLHQVSGALQYGRPPATVVGRKVPVGPQATHDPDLRRSYREGHPVLWKDKRVTLSMTHLRLLDKLLEANGRPVPHAEMFPLLISGQNVANLREHIKIVRQAFRDVDETFDRLRTVPMYGYAWT